jgi:hypothetical protein
VLGRAEALRAIGSIAKDEIANGDRRDFRISVWEDDGPALMVVSLALRVSRTRARDTKPMLSRAMCRSATDTGSMIEDSVLLPSSSILHSR